MSTSVQLEHINLTVSDPDASAVLLGSLFDWRVRWSGAAKDDGFTVHVGSDASYLALYRPPVSPGAPNPAGRHVNGLNHVAVVVDDLDAMEARVVAAGFVPFGHGRYEPGRRFYMLDHDGIEFEIVSYTS
jgi:catechol 2,3-dioxygenase-like lactoylglutathione lyase family enzyme